MKQPCKWLPHKVSCLFITDAVENITGYVTDITLRDKVVAQLTEPHGQVGTIMDQPVVSIDADAYIYEAILMMFSTKTRYLLIRDNGKYIGFLSRNKLTE